MKNKVKQILIKILKYIDELYDFITDHTNDDFKKYKKTINACVFNLSQIGELAGKVSDKIINKNPRNRMHGINLSMILGFLTNENY